MKGREGYFEGSGRQRAREAGRELGRVVGGLGEREGWREEFGVLSFRTIVIQITPQITSGQGILSLVEIVLISGQFMSEWC